MIHALQGFAGGCKPVYLARFLFCGLHCVAPYCARGGVRRVWNTRRRFLCQAGLRPGYSRLTRFAGRDGDVLPVTGRVHVRRLPLPALHWQCPYSVPGSRGRGRSVEEHKRHEETVQPGQSALLPRWPAAVALLTVGVLYAVLSEGLSLGPRAFVPALVAVLLVPLMTAHLRGSHRLARRISFGVIGFVTVAVVVSTVLLVSSALSKGTSAPALSRDAALLWIINVATFSVWYWEMDCGGPARRSGDGYRSQDFLFPQMNLGGDVARAWSPGFLDYLFLAFNTSTAFSPRTRRSLAERRRC